MTERDFYEYIAAFCKRPKMYTPTGSFYEIVSFLEGLGCGADVGERSYHSVFTPFCQWVERKFSLKGINVDWIVFRELSGSDSEALNQLPILYNEYLEHQQNSL